MFAQDIRGTVSNPEAVRPVVEGRMKKLCSPPRVARVDRRYRRQQTIVRAMQELHELTAKPGNPSSST